MHGEMARSSRVRCKEYKAELQRREASNLWDHFKLEHNGDVAQFSYKVERNFHHDTLLRQIEEAMRIDEETGSLLNDKMEFVKPFGIQLKATRMGH